MLTMMFDEEREVLKGSLLEVASFCFYHSMDPKINEFADELK